MKDMGQFIKITKVYIGANGRYASEYLINKDAIKYVNNDEEGNAAIVMEGEILQPLESYETIKKMLEL